MRYLKFSLCLCILMGISPYTSLYAINVCNLLSEKAEKEVLTNTKRGVPFQLLSIAVSSKDKIVKRRIIRIEYDLWDELVTIKEREKVIKIVPVVKSMTQICKIISFPEISSKSDFIYQLFLNPGQNYRFKYLRKNNKSPTDRLLNVDWDKVLKDYESEQLLFEYEFK